MKDFALNILQDFIKKNPGKDYHSFCEKTGIDISSQYFYTMKRMVSTGTARSTLNPKDIELIQKFLKRSKAQGYKVFKERYGDKISAYNFYTIRKFLIDGVPYDKPIRKTRKTTRIAAALKAKGKVSDAKETKKQIENFLKKNPFGTYVDFLKDTTSIVSDTYFYRLRARFNKTGTCEPEERPKANPYLSKKSLIEWFCIQNPTGTYLDFIEASPVRVSSEYFYTHRKRMIRKGKLPKPKKVKGKRIDGFFTQISLKRKGM